MKKTMIKALAIAIMLSITASMMIGCTKSQGNDTGKNAGNSPAPTATAQQAPAKLSIVRPDFGRVVKEGDPVAKEIEKKTNTKIEFILISPAEFLNKYGVMIASGSVPDISVITGFNYFQYVNQGIYKDIGSLLDKHGTNIKRVITDQSAWDLVKYKGKQYAIPYVNDPGKQLLVARQDWLDNLGLKVPTNLTDFSDMLHKFTFNDPDKNGKNDTYGFAMEMATLNLYAGVFSPFFGAFGIEPTQYYVRDNKVMVASISQEYKAALEYISQLYKDKVIDPDVFIMKPDQFTQKAVNSKLGSFCAGWSGAPQAIMDQAKMKEINPNAKWVPVPPMLGKDGKSGHISKGNVQNTVSISEKCANPEAAMKFLDFLATDEGWALSWYGIKGQHYTELYNRTPEGTAAMNEKWLDVFAQFIFDVDKFHKSYKASQPGYYEFMEAAFNSKIYTDDFYGIITSEYITLIPDINKFQEEWFVKFVTGSEPLSKYDEYVSQWKTKGGKQLVDSLIKEYNNRRGTNVSW